MSLSSHYSEINLLVSTSLALMLLMGIRLLLVPPRSLSTMLHQTITLWSLF